MFDFNQLPGGRAQRRLGQGATHRDIRLLIVDNGVAGGMIFVGPPGTVRLGVDLIEHRPDLTPILPELRDGNWDALAKVLSRRHARVRLIGPSKPAAAVAASSSAAQPVAALKPTVCALADLR